MSPPQPAIDEYDAWPRVAAASRGDGDAFAEVYRTYAPHVRSYFCRRVHDDHLADDLTSEAFLRCLRRIGTVRDVGRPFGAWLNTIARNLLLDLYKSAPYRHERPVAQHEHDGPAAHRDPLEDVLAIEIAREIRDAMHHLTSEQRACLYLRFWQGLTVSETADELNRGSAAVKQLQYRAMRNLAARLER